MLENQIKRKTSYKLRDFIMKIGSGATPKTTESEKYYTDSTGVKFLRVQNLSPEGLKLDGCKFINQETHNNMLARSKVYENNLLVKITGVGRMAIACVAPKDFEANVNQHMVVIKTESYEMSKLIAAFLNSDIGEKLASRRSTGGTRPALDYTALRSIPIILNESIINIMDNAYAQKQAKEKEATQLLDSINTYLLEELSISMPQEEENTLDNRKFYVSSSNVIGNRFDPRKYTVKYQKLFKAINDTPFPKLHLRDIILESVSGNWGMDEEEEDDKLISCLTIRATEFDNKYNLNLDNSRVKFRKYNATIYEKIALAPNDILVEKSGGSEDQPVGRVAFIEENLLANNHLAYSNFIHKIVVNESIAYSRFVFEYLRLMHNIKVTEVMQTQTNGIRNLIMGEYLHELIVLPKMDEQKAIARKASDMRKKAKDLQDEAEAILEKAKKEVESILSGDEDGGIQSPK